MDGIFDIVTGVVQIVALTGIQLGGILLPLATIFNGISKARESRRKRR